MLVFLLTQPLKFPAAAAVPQTEDGIVLLTDLQAHFNATNALYPSMATWCTECNNTSADACLFAQVTSLQGQLATATASLVKSGVPNVVTANAAPTGSSNNDNDNKSLYITMSVLGGLVAGAVIGGLAVHLRLNRSASRFKWNSHETSGMGAI